MIGTACKDMAHLIHICKGSRIERLDAIVDSCNEGLLGSRCLNLRAIKGMSLKGSCYCTIRHMA